MRPTLWRGGGSMSTNAPRDATRGSFWLFRAASPGCTVRQSYVEVLAGVMLVYHKFRVATSCRKLARMRVQNQNRQEGGPQDSSCCRAQMRAGSSSGAKERHPKYQRLSKVLVRTLTRFVVRRAAVAPQSLLRLASRLARGL